MHENTLVDQIDNSFASKKESEIYVIYVLIIAVALFLSYFLLFDPSEAFLNSNSKRLQDVTEKLQKETNYVNGARSVPARLDGEIKSSNVLLGDTRYVNSYLDGKLKELSYLLFNDKSWAGFMDRITFLAKEHRITILKIANDFKDDKVPQTENVKQVLDITIDSLGNFHNTIKFLNAIEESELVVDVYDTTVSSSNTTNLLASNIKIAVWGMLY